MLASHPIDVMILATDLGAASELYGERIGLEVLIESDDFVTFKCGGDSRLVVTRSATGTSEPQTKASWRVGNLAAEVAELRSRGVEVEEIDLWLLGGVARMRGTAHRPQDELAYALAGPAAAARGEAAGARGGRHVPSPAGLPKTLGYVATTAGDAV